MHLICSLKCNLVITKALMLGGERPTKAIKTLETSALRSEIVRAGVTKLRGLMDEHYSNIKTELHDMKTELIRHFAALKSEFTSLKSTVTDIEHSVYLFG